MQSRPRRSTRTGGQKAGRTVIAGGSAVVLGGAGLVTTSPAPAGTSRSALRRRTAGRWLAPWSILLLGGAACAGAGAGAGEDAGSHDEPLVMEVDDPYAEADVAALVDASETVVRGTVSEAEPGVRFGDAGDQLSYTLFTVDVDDVLAGHARDQVRVILSTHLGRREVAIEGRPVPDLGDEGLWFLTPLAPEFGTDGYVLTGQAGLLLLEGDEVTGGGPGEAPVHAEIERLGSAEAVVAHVRSVAG